MKLKLMGLVVVSISVFAAVADVAKVGDYVYHYSVTSNKCVEIVDEQLRDRVMKGERVLPTAISPRPKECYEVPSEINGLRVSSIGDGAFVGCGMTNLFIPESVSRIGAGAFCGCLRLQSVKLLGCDEIDEGAFMGCENLESVDLIGSSPKLKLSLSAFHGCEKLRRVRLPLEYCEIMNFCWALTEHSNVMDRVTVEMARDPNDESIMSALMYFCKCYADDMLINSETAERFTKMKLCALKRFVRNHPDRFVKDVDRIVCMFGEGPLLGLKAFYYQVKDGAFARVGMISDSSENRRQQQWNDLSVKERTTVVIRAYSCLHEVADMFLNAYDEPWAGEYMIDCILEDGDKVKKVDLYKRMARQEAKRVLMWRGDPEEEYRPKEAREKMLEYVQAIVDLGFAEQAQLLQMELEGVLKRRDVTGKVNAITTGTGWFASASHVATCWHVIQNAKRVSIEQKSGQRFDAKVIASDPANDIAILKVDGIKCSSALPIRPKGVKIADKVFTIGYPLSSLLGQAQKYSEGVVNSITGLSNDSRYYQISVPIQPGNSGGPLVDEKGFVIGLTSAALDALKLAVTTGAIPQNVNYAIKVRYLAAILDDAGIDYATATADKGTGSVVERVANATVLVVAE